MAIGRISGALLFSDLDRQSVDLAFTTNSKPLTYMDFTNFRFGVNTNSVVDTFTVTGTANVSGVAKIYGNLVAASGTDSTDTTTGALVVVGGAAVSGNLHAGNLFAYNLNGNIASSNAIFDDIAVLYTGYFGSLNTANAVISGGYVSGLTNAYITTSTITNLSSANVLLTGGNLSNINAQIDNLSSANVLLTGGNLSNINAQIDNLSSANVLLTGGDISNINLQANNFSTANVLIAGGNVSNISAQIDNLSSANVLLTGGNVSNISAQIDNLSSGNILVLGGIVYNVDVQANNFSTGNAVISGGYISSLSNATITTGNVESWYVNTLNSTIANVSELTANNFSSGNVLITGGYFSDINVQVSSGNVTANIAGNITATFGDFAANVYAAWLVGNVDGTIGNFANRINSANITVGTNYITQNTSQLQDVTITGNTVTSTGTDLVLSANKTDPNNIVRFDSVSAVDLPAGTTAQRPPGDYGLLRYNTDIGSIEWWSGAEWVPAISTINYQLINPDGINSVYTLNQPSTDVGILVNINGTIQQAGSSAYSVSGDQITFAEIPLVTDIIEIRYLAAGVAVVPTDFTDISSNVVPSANVTYDLGSSTNRWRDLWLSGNSIHLGAATINASDSGFFVDPIRNITSGNVTVYNNVTKEITHSNVNIVGQTGTPSDSSTPASWLNIEVSGVTYYMPLYQ